jgi:hypothetical protein
MEDAKTHELLTEVAALYLETFRAYQASGDDRLRQRLNVLAAQQDTLVRYIMPSAVPPATPSAVPPAPTVDVQAQERCERLAEELRAARDEIAKLQTRLRRQASGVTDAPDFNELDACAEELRAECNSGDSGMIPWHNLSESRREAWRRAARCVYGLSQASAQKSL